MRSAAVIPHMAIVPLWNLLSSKGQRLWGGFTPPLWQFQVGRATAPREESWTASAAPTPTTVHSLLVHLAVPSSPTTYPLLHPSQHPLLFPSLHLSHCMSASLSPPDNNNDSTDVEKDTSALCLPPGGRLAKARGQAITWATSTRGHNHTTTEQVHRHTPLLTPHTPAWVHLSWLSPPAPSAHPAAEAFQVWFQLGEPKASGLTLYSNSRWPELCTGLGVGSQPGQYSPFFIFYCLRTKPVWRKSNGNKSLAFQSGIREV